jgi:hypothetical protein
MKVADPECIRLDEENLLSFLAHAHLKLVTASRKKSNSIQNCGLRGFRYYTENSEHVMPRDAYHQSVSNCDAAESLHN